MLGYYLVVHDQQMNESQQSKVTSLESFIFVLSLLRRSYLKRVSVILFKIQIFT